MRELSHAASGAASGPPPSRSADDPGPPQHRVCFRGFASRLTSDLRHHAVGFRDTPTCPMHPAGFSELELVPLRVIPAREGKVDRFREIAQRGPRRRDHHPRGRLLEHTPARRRAAGERSPGAPGQAPAIVRTDSGLRSGRATDRRRPTLPLRSGTAKIVSGAAGTTSAAGAGRAIAAKRSTRSSKHDRELATDDAVGAAPPLAWTRSPTLVRSQNVGVHLSPGMSPD